MMDYIITGMCYTDKQHLFEERYVDVDIGKLCSTCSRTVTGI